MSRHSTTLSSLSADIGDSTGLHGGLAFGPADARVGVGRLFKLLERETAVAVCDLRVACGCGEPRRQVGLSLMVFRVRHRPRPGSGPAYMSRRSSVRYAAHACWHFTRGASDLRHPSCVARTPADSPSTPMRRQALDPASTSTPAEMFP